MSADNQNAAPSVDDVLELLDAKSASDAVQAMEARGDFKFRGIQRVYDLIRDWTANFNQRGILPSYEQISRDCELPEDKIRLYLLELMGRGGLKQRIVFALPALQFIAGAGARVSSMTVFCRPTQTEGSNARRYLQLYNDKNKQALAKWIGIRGAVDGNRLREHLMRAIQQGKLRDTQARAEIVKLFYTDFDDTPERRKLAYTLFARPLIQSLIEERKLLYLQGELPDGRKVNGVYFPGPRELEERFKILADYYQKHIDPGSAAPEGAEPQQLQERLRAFGPNYAGLNDTDKQIFEDLLLIAPAVTRVRKEQTETVRRQSLEQALEQLAKIPRVADASVFRNAAAETLTQLRGVGGVLHAEYPYRGRITDFFLHKNNVVDAVKFAREAFDKTEDDAHVMILSAMGLERYLDKDQYKAFLDLEQRVLFYRLPLVIRLWRMLVGKSKLGQKEMYQLKQKVLREQESEKNRLREEELKRARKQMVSERMSEQQREASAASGGAREADDAAPAAAEPAERPRSAFEAPEPVSEEEKYQKVQEEQRARDLLRKIVDTLDAAWDQRLLPNREYVQQYVTELDEDGLIMFLKKYGRKEVYSFRIRNEKPEYVWPVLISRRYLRRYGKRLLGRVQEEANEQRKANMPNQEKFDVATSIEDFLGRILPKI